MLSGSPFRARRRVSHGRRHAPGDDVGSQLLLDQTLGERLDGLDEVELRVDCRAECLQGRQRREQERELGRHGQAAPADERHDLDDEFARVDLVQLQVVVLGDQRRHVALQSRRCRRRRQPPLTSSSTSTAVALSCSMIATSRSATWLRAVLAQATRTGRSR